MVLDFPAPPNRLEEDRLAPAIHQDALLAVNLLEHPVGSP